MTASNFDASPAAQLSAAIVDGDSELIKQTLSAGANPDTKTQDGTPVLQATIATGNRQGFQSLLLAGAGPSQTDSEGDSAVHVAAVADDSWWLEKLLAAGADPNVANTQTGVTPLMDAVMTHRDSNIDLLLRSGANIDQHDMQGNTALHVAAKTNIAKYVLKFLEAGADPHAKNGLDVDFQEYLFMTPDSVLNAEIQRDREAIRYWLHVNQIPIRDADAQ